MRTFNMEYLGESEGKSACEQILKERADSVKGAFKNNPWPWLVAGGFALLWITKKGDRK